MRRKVWKKKYSCQLSGAKNVAMNGFLGQGRILSPVQDVKAIPGSNQNDKKQNLEKIERLFCENGKKSQ